MLADPLDLPAPREREESRDSPDPLASKVYLDPQVLQVKEASPVIRVCQERQEQLVLQVPEASAVSPEREAALDPRVCRALAVCPELQGLTDPRVQLAPGAAPVPRAPPACRGCPARGELPESQDPKATEVTTARKDQRALPAKTDPEV